VRRSRGGGVRRAHASEAAVRATSARRPNERHWQGLCWPCLSQSSCCGAAVVAEGGRRRESSREQLAPLPV